MVDPRELRAIVCNLCRDDFASFAIRAFPVLEGMQIELNWHIHAICRLTEKVTDGDVRRALVCIPPRYLKTYLISVAYTAWLLGKNPKTRIIVATYGALLSEKISADTLKLMKSPFYRRTFPNTHLDPKKQNRTEIATTAGGYRFSTSVGATLTGRGADVIIIDDPLKADEARSPTARENSIDWFNSSVHSRFNHPKKGKMIVVAQRLHLHDLPGHLLEVGGWEPLILAAINSTKQTIDMVKGGKLAILDAGRILQRSRHSRADLEQLKKQMGEQAFEAQYNQRPLPPGGATFREEWVNRYQVFPKPSQIIAIVQSWDTAYEGDEANSYSVCTTWAVCADGFYLLDVWRGHPSFPDLVKKVYALKGKWNAKMVIIENKASGISLIETIRELDGQRWLVSVAPATGKVERAEQQSVKFEQGRVCLPTQAEWLPAYESELFSFPHCKHVDQVDSTVQFLAATDYSNFHHRLRLL